ncbi:DUF2339 domain-containing protein [Caulobacter sp. NIBR1757]|uniref:DUF2339 domain-containing protein n=1 Tax=Caulobacter sp. NIBR1757 TaxID=3016000 RepID=UPI0022F0E873|nr:DUF2339 domain-containing protein [Caulobacter sp. NIBR1757]WGM39049.1 hypothetical protein AMEJIAPC_01961 [Caulobacter sp. NIBR1757]
MTWVAIFVLTIALWRLWEEQKGLRRQVSQQNERLERLEFPVTVTRLDRLSEDRAPKAAAPEPEVAAPTPPLAARRPPSWRDHVEPEPPPPRPAPVRPEPPRINLGELLAERGLAWLGGGALVLGGVFLVGYAAQQGWFNPVVRLIAAVGLAGLMLTASEVLRRRPGPRQQALASAVLAGAGASTLYATLWAAFALYHYIGGAVAAVLLLAVSGLLLALSRDRREPLALMALLGAFIAPLITDFDAWGDAALMLHTLGVAAAGLVVAQRRQWETTALAASAGALVLHLATCWAGEPWRQALAPLALVGLTLAWRQRRTGESRLLTAAILPVAFGLATFGLFVLFGAVRDAAIVAGAIASALVLTAMVAIAARRGWTSGWLLALPTALLVGGLALDIGVAHGTVVIVARIGALLAIVGLAAAGLSVFREPRLDAAPAPLAIGAVLLAQLAGFGLPSLPGAGMVLLGALPALGAAILLGRRAVPDRHQDAWTLSAAASLLLAVFIAAPDWNRPAAFAAMALGFAVAQRRLDWLGLGIAAMAAVGLASSAALAPDFVLAGLESAGGAGRAVAACLSGAALCGLAAWRLVPAPPISAARQVLAAAGIGLGLIGAFLALRFAAAGESPAIGLLMESALRTLLLAMAGASALLMLREARGVIARFGPHVLIGMALASFLSGPLFWLNPWWGVDHQAIEAVPLINTLLLAYMAPAAVLGVAATRLYRRPELLPARLYGAAAAVMAFVWALLELRHLFHGPRLWSGETSFAEWTTIGLLIAVMPLVLRRFAPAPARNDAGQAASVISLVALPLVFLLVGVLHAPWWGLAGVPFGAPWIAFPALLTLTGLAVLNARALTGRGREMALVIAAAFALVSVTLAACFGFHPADLRATTSIGLETWTYSALWALFGAGLLALGSARRERSLRWMALGILFFTAGKVLLFDMASLDGVIRAASFLAVGALMVAAAVLARRLGRPNREDV